MAKNCFVFELYESEVQVIRVKKSVLSQIQDDYLFARLITDFLPFAVQLGLMINISIFPQDFPRLLTVRHITFHQSAITSEIEQA